MDSTLGGATGVVGWDLLRLLHVDRHPHFLLNLRSKHGLFLVVLWFFAFLLDVGVDQSRHFECYCVGSLKFE